MPKLLNSNNNTRNDQYAEQKYDKKLQDLIKQNKIKLEMLNKLSQDNLERQQNLFPNLYSLQRVIGDPNQKRSLQQIIQKNPQLAFSLDVYASGTDKLHNKYIQKKQNNNFGQSYNAQSQQDIQNNYRNKPWEVPINELRNKYEQEKQQKQMSKSQDKIQQNIHEKKYNQQFIPSPPSSINQSVPQQMPIRQINVNNSDSQNKQNENITQKNYSNISNLLGNNYANGTLNKTKFQIPSLNSKPGLFMKKQNGKFNYFFGPGNNHEMIRRVMQDRSHYWQEVPLHTYLIHFKWQQYEEGYNYKQMPSQGEFMKDLQVLNIFEFHKTITSKPGLIKSLQSYLNNDPNEIFNMIPLAFIINLGNFYREDHIKQFVDYYLKYLPNNVQETQKSVKVKFENFQKYADASQIQQNESDAKFAKNIVQYELPDVLRSEDSYLWILKPADWNRGEGVYVFSNLKKLEELLKNFYKGYYETSYSELDKQNDENKKKDQAKEPKKQFMFCRQFIIQKYIEHPLLINGRKFDIRVWVLMSHQMEFYLFKEGYIRTSSEVFDLKDNNPFIHLTNNAVQKYSKNYSSENGNQLSYDEFQGYLDSKELECNFRKKVLPKIKAIIKSTMYSVRFQLNKNARKYCFQLYGYDFMLDKNFKPWIIEINTNPCLEESSPLLKMLLPRMMDDLLRLTVDQIFPPPFVGQRSSKEIVEKSEDGRVEYDKFIKQQGKGCYPVHNYKTYENMWEYLGSF